MNFRNFARKNFAVVFGLVLVLLSILLYYVNCWLGAGTESFISAFCGAASAGLIVLMLLGLDLVGESRFWVRLMWVLFPLGALFAGNYMGGYGIAHPGIAIANVAIGSLVGLLDYAYFKRLMRIVKAKSAT